MLLNSKTLSLFCCIGLLLACSKPEVEEKEPLLPIESSLDICGVISHGKPLLICETTAEYPSISYCLKHSVTRRGSDYIFFIEGVQENDGFDAIGPASFQYELASPVVENTEICFKTKEWERCATITVKDSIIDIKLASQNEHLLASGFCIIQKPD